LCRVALRKQLALIWSIFANQSFQMIFIIHAQNLHVLRWGIGHQEPGRLMTAKETRREVDEDTSNGAQSALVYSR
jgi:hypothetical protein